MLSLNCNPGVYQLDCICKKSTLGIRNKHFNMLDGTSTRQDKGKLKIGES